MRDGDPLRFQDSARIKKIMQTDEDVGKIALSVPVLVCKCSKHSRYFSLRNRICSLILISRRDYSQSLGIVFARPLPQNLRYYTSEGSKDMNSVHLKHCVQSYNVFDFLRDIVSKVPDHVHGHGHTHSNATSDDRAVSRRRKAIGYDGNETDDEAKKIKMADMGHASGGRGRGRERGRGRGCRARNMDRVRLNPRAAHPSIKNTVEQVAIRDHKAESRKPTKETSTAADSSHHGAQPFDLNASSTDNEGNSAKNPSATAVAKNELYPGWSLSEVDKIPSSTRKHEQQGR